MSVSLSQTPSKRLEVAPHLLSTPRFALDSPLINGDENFGNKWSPTSPLSALKSTLKSSKKCLDTVECLYSEPKSPTKGAKLGNSPRTISPRALVFPAETAPTTLAAHPIVHAPIDLSYLNLLPIQCDLDTSTLVESSEEKEKTADPLTLTLTNPLSKYETLDEEDEQEASSPSKSRLSPSRCKVAAPPTHPEADQRLSANSCGATPAKRPLRSSITPLFQVAPLFPSRTVPMLQTPSRIPVPTSAPKCWSAAPGIRMPGDMHLSYAKKEESADSSTARLDLGLDIAPKCTAYLSSPYPRLTKYANHPTRFYEKKLSEKRETFHSPVVAAKLIPSVQNEPLRTPQRATSTRVATCASTGMKKPTRGPTVPRSPKLATASRLRKCQCCESGIHGDSKKHGVDSSTKKRETMARTTIGKRQTTMRRRPSPSKPPANGTAPFGKHAPHTPSHCNTPGAKARATSTVKKPSVTPSCASRTPIQRKLNLTTSLPQFAQPLALIAPTPDPSRDEVQRKLHQPLPTIPSSVKKSSVESAAAPTPIKMKSLEEALGPNYHLIHAFNETQPDPLEPLQESLRPSSVSPPILDL